MDKYTTTIRLRKETKNDLDGFKPHLRATYDEVLRILIDSVKEKRGKNG